MGHPIAMLFIVQQFHLSCWWTRNQEIANNTSHKSTTRPSRRSPSSPTSNKFWIENMNLPRDWFSASCWPSVLGLRSYTEIYEKLYWELWEVLLRKHNSLQNCCRLHVTRIVISSYDAGAVSRGAWCLIDGKFDWETHVEKQGQNLFVK